MKLVFGLLSTALLSNAAVSAQPLRPYWFLLKDDQRTWCGYLSEQKFQAQAGEIKPLESARLTLMAGAPKEITYQVQPESGDWVIADKYSFYSGSIKLKRATIFAQTGIQVFQESEIHAGKASPLKTVSVKNLNGTAASAKDLDYPNLPIEKGASEFPFLSIAQEMGKKSTPVLCGKPSAR